MKQNQYGHGYEKKSVKKFFWVRRFLMSRSGSGKQTYSFLWPSDIIKRGGYILCYVKHLIDTDEAWHNGFSVFYPLVICAHKNWIEIKTDSFQQTLSFWKHKYMARSIRWSVWRRFLSEENWGNLCDCLGSIGTLVWARFGGTNPSRSRIWLGVTICFKFFAFEFCIQINSIKTFVCIYLLQS
jgi:hypothetical protein